MKIIRYLSLSVACWILIDACQDRNLTTADTDTGDLTSLCEPGSQYDKMPVLGLPNASTVPGGNVDSILVAFLQNRADKLSWQTFIAMNWLATPTGMPDTTQCFGRRDGITVWEHWMPGRELFRSDGQPPRPWQYGLSTAGHPNNSRDAPLFRLFKLNELSQFNPDRQSVPNRHGLYTLYEVFYNRQVYDYVVGGGLYSIAGQQQFVQKWPRQPNGLYLTNADKKTDTIGLERLRERAYLPVGGAKDTMFTYTYNSLTSAQPQKGQLTYYKNVGAIMLKSAWTVLTPAEDPALYHTRVVQLNGKQVTLGLVGLHIAHKLAEAPRWMWSTFEHDRNSPRVDEHGLATLKPGVDYLYFNKSRNDTSTYNKPTRRPADRTRIQVVRMQQRLNSTDLINDQFHALIRQASPKSVWLNYRLVGTQWPFSAPDALLTDGDIRPQFLANSVIETYHQTRSSCMGCHKLAQLLADSTHHGYFADFVWGMALQTSSSKRSDF